MLNLFLYIDIMWTLHSFKLSSSPHVFLYSWDATLKHYCPAVSDLYLKHEKLTLISCQWKDF